MRVVPHIITNVFDVKQIFVKNNEDSNIQKKSIEKKPLQVQIS